ncbi:HU family DNA-binding protein [Bilifractor porci]|jgi:DNA-binding protein HU-beta|uniref:HU family DNA-binding protein n=1 Tax=Bilifractor porci TaxID=2606636 RepID=A0A7X2P851_9FIRM|nr:HU family DNA-binding protein [Bilifractor porci]MST81463.1 HU family DNA-binding protein [Bilifractor porci]
MNRMELIEQIRVKTGKKKKDIEEILTAFTETVSEELDKGEKVRLAGFGTFEVFHRTARSGRNPKTGEQIMISDGKIPKFRAGKRLRKHLNQ